MGWVEELRKARKVEMIRYDRRVRDRMEVQRNKRGVCQEVSVDLIKLSRLDPIGLSNDSKKT